MIKPLLKVIPALSGNIKLACNLEKFTKIGEHTYKGICRNSFLYPLDSKAFQSPIEVSLLQSSWEYDIVKFYNVYKDIFYDNTFFINENKCLLLNDYSDVLNNRNIDVEFGCKRVSFEKSKKQLCFFAPIYCESFEDLPEYFEITMLFKNKDGYSVEKKLRIYLNDKDSYLTKYLERYFKKIDDNAIFFNPKASQATYYGINVKGGGLNKFVDNIILTNFINETTVNQYDNIISSGFKRNGLILQQVMPLAFYFSPDDILSDIEKNKYKYFKVKLSGAYYKDNVELPFYTFDTNYTTLSIPTKIINQNTGIFENKYNYDNILGIENDKFALNTLSITDYATDNKINVYYNRWKLKYSDDNNPYFTNTNYIFSKNQKSENMYYQYPQHYISSLLTNITNNQINLILPIGKNIENFYKNHDYLVKNYYLSLNNYISNWFEMTEQIDTDYILSNVEWEDVHNDNKIFYNGILYDFNRISEFKNKKQFDKFAVLCYVDDSEILDKSDVKHYVVSEQSLTYFLNSENIINEESVSVSSTLLRDINDKDKSNSYSLYDITSKENNYKYEMNQFFTYNTLGVGKYVNVFDLNKFNNLYFEANRFYPISLENYKTIFDFYTESNEISVISSINIGYVLIDIPFSENIISKLIALKDENIYFQYSFSEEKLPLSKFYSYDVDTTNKYNFILFYKCYLIPENIFKDTISSFFPNITVSYLLQHIYNIYERETETLYCEYYPIYQKGNKTLKNVFVPSKIYDSGDIYFNIGDEQPENLLVIDSLNLTKTLKDYHTISGDLYIENILENKIVLGDLNSDNLYNLYVNDRKDEILEKLETTYTYSYNFGGNKYNVERVINKINCLFISEDTISISKKINVVSYNLDFKSPDNYTPEYKEIGHYSTIKKTYYITSYTIDLSSSIFEKNIETAYNRLNNCCDVDVYAYTYSIDYTYNTINIKGVNGKNIDLCCKNIEQTYSVAYQCGMLDYVELPSGFYSYIQKFNGAGTYFNSNSVMFKHPQKLIKTISGLPFGSLNQNNIINVNDNVKFELCDFIDLKDDFNIKNTQNPIETKLEKLIHYYPTSSVQFLKLKNKNHLQILCRKYLNDNAFKEYNFERLSHITSNLFKTDDPTRTYILSNKDNIIPIFIRIHLYDTDINILSSQMYSTVIPIFIDISKDTVYSDNRLVFGITEINAILNDFTDCIFTLSNVNENYINNFINYVKTINNITITNDFKFELYYTNTLVYLTKDILNKIINIGSDKLFKDIYLYELEEQQSITNDIQYFKRGDLTTKLNVSNKYFFNPLFNDVYLENKKDTIIYQSFIVDKLIEVKSKSNSQNDPIFYKYNKPNKIMLMDVSEVYNTDTYSFIYNTENKNYTAYSYSKLNEETGEIEILFTPSNQVLAYNFAYYSSSIPTYDKYIPSQIGFKELPENLDRSIFENHNLNILIDDNGTKYGLYIINIPFNNISNSFNIVTENTDEIKYFTTINGISIINNHLFITKCFKYIVPILKHNILNELYKIDCANIIFNTKFSKRYKIYNGKLISKTIQNNIISLNRYYDSIVPYIYKTTNLENYSLPVRTKNTTQKKEFYNDTINIYNYTGIPIDNEQNKKIKPFVEYKYFNDNQFINLEKEINIFVSDKLTYNEVLTLQETSVMQKYFKKYINSFINIKFSDEEMLFLYNKYSVIILATPLQITNNQTEKYYSVNYKFTLN